jgi:DNA-binding NarL/FixJ family response regulator
MKLVAKGLTNKEIAEELHLSEYTVKNHMSRILKQLDAENRSEAVETVRECGYEVSL